MDYIASSLPLDSSEAVDRRRATRKPLKLSALIGTPEAGILQGQTLDISEHGLSVMLAVPVRPGALCSVRFYVAVNGVKLNVIGAGKVTNCSCMGMDGFRIGLKFKIKDQSVEDRLYEFLKLRATTDTALPASPSA